MAATQEPQIRYATDADVPEILALIIELAEYENAVHEVEATEEKLRATLSLAPFAPTSTSTSTSTSGSASTGAAPGYARTLLIFPPDNPEKPAGMALFFHNYSTWRAAPGVYLEDLFVRPAFRGAGYGGRLLAELARVTKECGGRRLEWSVLKWNEPSIRFYQGKSVNATRMEDWVGMRVEKDALDKLAASHSSGAA